MPVVATIPADGQKTMMVKLSLPVIRQLAAAVYRLIAGNRQRMPAGSPACALPPPGYDPSNPGTKTL